MLDAAREISKELEHFIKEAENLETRRAGVDELQNLKQHLLRAGSCLSHLSVNSRSNRAGFDGITPASGQPCAYPDKTTVDASTQQLVDELRVMKDVRDERRSELFSHLERAQNGNSSVGGRDDLVRKLSDTNLQLAAKVKQTEDTLRLANSREDTLRKEMHQERTELQWCEAELRALCKDADARDANQEPASLKNLYAKKVAENKCLRQELGDNRENFRQVQEMSRLLGDQFANERTNLQERHALSLEFAALQREGMEENTAGHQAQLENEFGEACAAYNQKMKDLQRTQKQNAHLCSELEKIVSAGGLKSSTGNVTQDYPSQPSGFHDMLEKHNALTNSGSADVHASCVSQMMKVQEMLNKDQKSLANLGPEHLGKKLQADFDSLAQWSVSLSQELEREKLHWQDNGRHLEANAKSNGWAGEKIKTQFVALAERSVSLGKELENERSEWQERHNMAVTLAEMQRTALTEEAAMLQVQMQVELEEVQYRLISEEAEVKRLQEKTSELNKQNSVDTRLRRPASPQPAQNRQKSPSQMQRSRPIGGRESSNSPSDQGRIQRSQSPPQQRRIPSAERSPSRSPSPSAPKAGPPQQQRQRQLSPLNRNAAGNRIASPARSASSLSNRSSPPRSPRSPARQVSSKESAGSSRRSPSPPPRSPRPSNSPRAANSPMSSKDSPTPRQKELAKVPSRREAQPQASPRPGGPREQPPASPRPGGPREQPPASPRPGAAKASSPRPGSKLAPKAKASLTASGRPRSKSPNPAPLDPTPKAKQAPLTSSGRQRSKSPNPAPLDPAPQAKQAARSSPARATAAKQRTDESNTTLKDPKPLASASRTGSAEVVGQIPSKIEYSDKGGAAPTQTKDRNLAVNSGKAVAEVARQIPPDVQSPGKMGLDQLDSSQIKDLGSIAQTFWKDSDDDSDSDKVDAMASCSSFGTDAARSRGNSMMSDGMPEAFQFPGQDGKATLSKEEATRSVQNMLRQAQNDRVQAAK